MRRTTLQFHATPDELSEWLDEFFARYDVSAGVERFSTRESATVPLDEVGRIAGRQGADRIVLSTADVVSLDPHEPDQCWITLGRLEGGRLSQSALSASWTNTDAGRAWQALRRLIVGRTHDGVLSVNPRTGDRVPFRGFRFSEGTRRLAHQGVALRPFAGDAQLEIPPVA